MSLSSLLEYASAILLLVVAGRFASVEVAHWSMGYDGAGAKVGDSTPSASKDPLGPNGTMEALNEASRLRDAKVKALKDEVELGGLDSSASGPETRLRRILIDWGPERSRVFIAGKEVGRTPYGGQVPCEDGSSIIVTVLPERGAPLERTLLCSEQRNGRDTKAAEGTSAELQNVLQKGPDGRNLVLSPPGNE